MPHSQQTPSLLLSHPDRLLLLRLLQLLLLNQEDGSQRVGLRLMPPIQLPSLGQASRALRVTLKCVTFNELSSHN